MKHNNKFATFLKIANSTIFAFSNRNAKSALLSFHCGAKQRRGLKENGFRRFINNSTILVRNKILIFQLFYFQIHECIVIDNLPLYFKSVQKFLA